MNLLISACLLGVRCRYDGQSKPLDGLERLLAGPHHLVPVCPEVMGGLATPRDPAERLGERVVTRAGVDVTQAYLRGAREVLRLSKLLGCTCALLKERSPSCGCGVIYDGTFSGTLVEGNGLTADLLLKNGVRVLGERDLPLLL